MPSGANSNHSQLFLSCECEKEIKIMKNKVMKITTMVVFGSSNQEKREKNNL